MQHIAFLSFISCALLGVASGKSSSSSTSTSSSAASSSTAVAAASLIPADITTGCASFLNQLDADTIFQTCLAPLLSATDAFAPTSSPTSSQVASVLSSLCSSTTASACPESLFRTNLASFSSACTSELTGSSPNAVVRQLYDMVYILYPFRGSVCATDGSGAFCAQEVGKGANDAALPGEVAQAGQFLAQAPSTPNATTFASTGILYQFLTASSPSTELCGTCAQNIMKPFISFETDVPYAYGIKNSPTLNPQSELWNAISTGCNSTVSGSVVNNAGASLDGTTGGLASGGVSLKVSVAGLGGALAAIAAVMILL